MRRLHAESERCSQSLPGRGRRRARRVRDGAGGAHARPVEATTGGSSTRGFGVPGASRFRAEVVVYSVAAAGLAAPRRAFAFGHAREQLCDGTGYVRSRVFTSVVGAHFRERFGVDWVLAESGATQVGRLPERLRSAGAFTVVTALGPDKFMLSRVIKADPGTPRAENMRGFARAAIELLDDAVKLHQSRAML